MAALKEMESEEGPKRLGFSANLEETSLADLVQLKCLSGAQCVVRVSSGDDTGYLYFRGGAIVHAMSASNSGEAAALEILAWSSGRFEACNAGWPDRDSIDANAQALLLRAAQVRDESGHHNLVPFQRSRSTTALLREDEVLSTPPPDSTGSPSSRRVRSGSNPLTRVHTAVRLDPSGGLMSSRGPGTGDLAAAAALATRLANLVGDALGLERLRSIEASGCEQTLLVLVEKSGNLLALRAPLDTDLTVVRERHGL